MKLIVILFAVQMAYNYVSGLENSYFERQPSVCEQNEVFREVVSVCPPTCQRPSGALCKALIRKPSCVCAPGTVRDTDTNKCVQREDCPPKETKSNAYDDKKIVCDGQNEIYKEWVSACPVNCPIPIAPPQPEYYRCHAIINKPSCVCTNGTIRDTINKRCVARNDCP